VMESILERIRKSDNVPSEAATDSEPDPSEKED
jgi:hypothetical protein